jgi:hypothetical protein
MRRLATIAWLAVLGVSLAPAAGAEEVAMASARVAASPSTVWTVLNAFESWDRVFPGVSQIGVERVDPGRGRLHVTSETAGHRVHFTLVTIAVPEELRLECVLDPSHRNDVAVLSLAWRVSALPDGGSHIELRVRSDSGWPVPHFVERRVAERSARQTVAGLAEAVERPVVVASSVR